jgi:hypothetical protein
VGVGLDMVFAGLGGTKGFATSAQLDRALTHRAALKKA